MIYTAAHNLDTLKCALRPDIYQKLAYSMWLVGSQEWRKSGDLYTYKSNVITVSQPGFKHCLSRVGDIKLTVSSR